MDRSKFIGGSDAAGVLGLSRWKTPLSVWAEKTGQYIPPEVENEAKELGKELEDYVAKRFERKTGKKVERADAPFFHLLHAFIGGHVDRLISLEDAGLECKTVSAWKAKEWDGEEIPQEYLIQCYHYMMVTRKKKWYLAVLIGNQDFKIKELYWDEKIIRELESREVEFWNSFVVPKVMPFSVSYKDTETLAGLFPQADESKKITLGDEANILIENLSAYKQDLKNIETLIQDAENKLKRLLGDAEGGETSLYDVYWKNMKTNRLDIKLLEQTHPALVKDFKKETQSRRFTYKSKGENNKL